MEEFRKIEGYDNYSVSNLGNVRNDNTGRILKAGNSLGYKMVGLIQNKIRKIFGVHRLVAIAFIPNPLNKPCVDHINNIRDDNRLENLRWVTTEQNNQNRKICIKNTSGIKGVSYHKQSKQWMASISINGKLQYIGLYKHKEDAIKARVQKSIDIQGNFINQCEIVALKRIELNKELEELERLEREFEELIK